MIPKIIHYCWLSDDPIPEDLQTYMKSWKEKLPDYDFVLWNFEKFDKKSSKWVEQAFNSKKYAFSADYIRLYAICNYGGIYMDMDIEVLRAFDDLLDAPLMIAYEDEEKTGIEAGCFGAEKGNPFITDCLSYYDNRSFVKPDGTFDTVPLPKIMAQFLSLHEEINPENWHFFTNKSYKTGVIEIQKNSYAIHHFAGSWLDRFQKDLSAYIQKIIRKYGKTKKASLLIVWFHFRKSLKYLGVKKWILYWTDFIKRKIKQEIN